LTQESTQEQFGKRERMLALIGVMTALLLAALDQTIVATAGPAIQRDLAIPASQYAWITTAYLVAATVMVPIWGKLSDRLGRKPVLLAGVALFLVGSLLCGIAPGTFPLIAFRAVQGIGAASLFTSVFAVIADLFPPAQRGRYMGLIGGVMGIASFVGPLAGGIITDRFGWHWVFFINLPVGAIAIWFIARKMPPLPPLRDAARLPLDVAGALFLIVAVVPLLAALSLGRSAGTVAAGGYAWTSPLILTLLSVALLSAILFIRTERRVPDPIVHFEIFRDPTIALASATVFVLGSAFLFAVIFLPLFLVNVSGISATGAGLTLMPLTMGMIAGSVGAGQVVARIGNYRRLLLGSLLLLMAAFAIMGFTLTATSTQWELSWKMVLIGLGMGPSLPLYTLAVQHAARPGEIGVVTAAATFSRSLGQVIGLTVFGAIFAGLLATTLARDLGEALTPLPPVVRELVASVALSPGPGLGEGPSTVAVDTIALRESIMRASDRLTAEDAALALASIGTVKAAVDNALATAISMLFRVGVLVIGVALLLTLRMPDLSLHRRGAGEGAAPEVH
jgi:EmrB/QacA subfamily drug resistance transporter